MEKKLEISCSVDLYGGDVKAGKWYDVTEKCTEDMFWFFDEVGSHILVSTKNCAHLEYFSLEDAYWTVREVQE